MGMSELARAVAADADDKRFLVWSLVLVFAPLAWLGVRTSWQQAQRAASFSLPIRCGLLVQGECRLRPVCRRVAVVDQYQQAIYAASVTVSAGAESAGGCNDGHCVAGFSLAACVVV